MTTPSGVEAADALREAAAAVGLEVESGLPGLDSGVDAVLVTPSGDKIVLEIKHQSLTSAVGLDQRLVQWTAQRPDDAVLRVVVADR